jgi:citrate lyase alpha subunit
VFDTDFNVNVMTGSNGVLRGASGGHSDTAAGADLTPFGTRAGILISRDFDVVRVLRQRARRIAIERLGRL